MRRHHQSNCSDYPVIAAPQKYSVTATPSITLIQQAFIAETHQKNAAMAVELPTQMQLAQGWILSDCTLERWRSFGEDPVYIKLGFTVRYSVVAQSVSPDFL